VDLGVTNASPPSHTAFFDRLDGISSSDTGLQVQQASKDVCDLPPVAVNVGTSTGRVKVRYVGWEEPCRALSQNIHTSVGDVQGLCPLVERLPLLTTDHAIQSSGISYAKRRTTSRPHSEGSILPSRALPLTIRRVWVANGS